MINKHTTLRDCKYHTVKFPNNLEEQQKENPNMRFTTSFIVCGRKRRTLLIVTHGSGSIMLGQTFLYQPEIELAGDGAV